MQIVKHLSDILQLVLVTSHKILLPLLLVSLANHAHAQGPCGSIFVVTPPNNHAGTIFLDNVGKDTYRRGGYIVVGTILQVLNNPETPDGSHNIRPKRGGAREKYYEFVAANGLKGFVNGDSISSLEDLIAQQRASNFNGTQICDFTRGLVVPTDPDKQIDLYYRPISSGRDGLTYTFSRSNYVPVLVGNDPAPIIEATDGTQYYQVRFAEQEQNPSRVVWKSGYLRLTDEDLPSQRGTYRISYLPNDDIFESLISEKIKCDGNIDCGLQYLNRWFGSSDSVTEAAQKILEKSCGIEDRGKVTFAAKGDLNFLKFFPISGAISGQTERTIVLPRDEAYLAKTFHGVSEAGQVAEVLLVLECDGSDPVQARKLSVVFDDEDFPRILLTDEAVLGYLDQCIVAARTFDAGSGYEDKVFVVPYNLSQTSYFKSYSYLRRFLEGRVGMNIHSTDRERIIAFLIDTMSVWQGINDSPPNKLPQNCL